MSSREAALQELAPFLGLRLDAHCHVQHDAAFLAGEAPAGNHYFCMTETPGEYEQFAVLALPSYATLGLGLHPWQVAAAEEDLFQQLDAFMRGLSQVWLVGEVGLDFSSRRAPTRAQQLEAFGCIAQACGQVGGKVLSIHGVQAAKEVLDLLDQTEYLESCLCIFHWFSGNSDQLQRAIKAGCWFSVGPRMLATKRGKAYAQPIPQQRLLYESDAFSL